MTNHKAIADHIALGSSPAQTATLLGVSPADVDECLSALATILRTQSLEAIRGRLVQMGYGRETVAPWTAPAFRGTPAAPHVAPAA
ncbi:hypothetical protein [Williamsia deligens]|uniref:Uncharacterized protein n=1 Tax=Williamsia deligens TaxID=321325 RepID=A0ABW3GA55_9NOCA|nr:hypothetical protein [Williamsia deligens]MCP2193496.1 hypothetical protein [Williamsia deligens]